MILLDHPTATLDRADVVPIGEQVRSVAARRGAAIVAVTADQAFAAAVAGRVLTLDAATGRLTESRRSRWFGVCSARHRLKRIQANSRFRRPL